MARAKKPKKRDRPDEPETGEKQDEPPPSRLQSLAGNTKAVLGFVGVVVGVVVAVIGLPGKFEEAFGATSAEKKQLELDEKRAQLRQEAPHLDVSYLFLAQGLAMNETKVPASAADAVTLVSYPSVGVAGFDPNSSPRDCAAVTNIPYPSIAFLVIENHGRREAVNVIVEFTRLNLREVVPVRERTSGGDDYVAKLRAAARSITPDRVAVSRPIQPGSGVRIPLWSSVTKSFGSTPWCVTSTVALLPKQVSFRDPVLPESGDTTLAVRRLVAPTIYTYGVEGRG